MVLIKVLKMFLQGCKLCFKNDFDYWWYYFKNRKFSKLKNYVWSRFNVRDIGIGLMDPIYMRYPNLTRYPREIEVEITTRCHLKCLVCEHTYWSDSKYSKQDINYGDFVKICEQFPKLSFINVTGEGTCWLNKDFNKILEYLHKRNIYILMVESFDLFTKERVDKIFETDVNRIELSLDATTKETYEKLKVGANWERVMDNLKYLVAEKKRRGTPFPYLFVRFIVTSENVNEIPAMPALIHDLDLNCGRKVSIEFVGLLNFKEIEKYNVACIPVDIIEQTQKNAKKFGVTIIWSHTNNNMYSIDYCAKWIQPYIMMGGYTVLDCALVMANNREYLKSISPGSLLEKNFKDIWYGNGYKRVRHSVNQKNKPVPLYCKGCRGANTSCREKKYGVHDYMVAECSKY